MRSIQLTLVAVVAVALSACGGGGAKIGKEGAAQAVFQASQPVGKGASGQGVVERALASGANGSLEITASCDKGGNATLKLNITGGGTSGEFSYNVTYNNCSEDGANRYNGSMTTTFAASGSGTSATFTYTMNGRLTISGEIDDFVEANNVRLSMGIFGSGTGATVSMSINGSIRTSTETHVYNNETLSITVDGKLEPRS